MVYCTCGPLENLVRYKLQRHQENWLVPRSRSANEYVRIFVPVFNTTSICMLSNCRNASLQGLTAALVNVMKSKNKETLIWKYQILTTEKFSFRSWAIWGIPSIFLHPSPNIWIKFTSQFQKKCYLVQWFATNSPFQALGQVNQMLLLQIFKVPCGHHSQLNGAGYKEWWNAYEIPWPIVLG